MFQYWILPRHNLFSWPEHSPVIAIMASNTLTLCILHQIFTGPVFLPGVSPTLTKNQCTHVSATPKFRKVMPYE